MNYYHDVNNAKAYTEMCEGYNAQAQLPLLSKVLKPEGSILELGSGPGNDLEILAKSYQVTGSDYSPAFVALLNKRFPNMDCLKLDAVSIATEKKFNAIYSNKVLHHLNDAELRQSFCRQAELLLPGGYVFHLVWKEIEVPEMEQGLLFQARDLVDMQDIMGADFTLIESQLFSEFEAEDSLAILARKTP